MPVDFDIPISKAVVYLIIGEDALFFGIKGEWPHMFHRAARNDPPSNGFPEHDTKGSQNIVHCFVRQVLVFQADHQCIDVCRGDVLYTFILPEVGEEVVLQVSPHLMGIEGRDGRFAGNTPGELTFHI